jgi:tetratricopeptide (TPR) repeat protein
MWDEVVLACLERKPEYRPSSAGYVAQMLARGNRRIVWKRAIAAAVITAAVVFSALWAVRPHVPAEGAQIAVDQARVAVESRTKDGYQAAIESYKKAIALDSKWAQPWAELAYAYAAAGNAAQIPRETASREAQSAASHAIALDRSSAKAWGAMGWVQSLDFDEWPKAESSLLRATRLSPEDGQMQYWYGVVERKKGNFPEAERADKSALILTHEKDPMIWCELAFLYWTSEQMDKLRDHMVQQLIAFPNFGLTRYLHARELKLEGHFIEAEGELDFSEKLQYPMVTVLVERASLEAYRGRPDAARQLLHQLENISRSQSVDGLLVAGVYARLGDTDAAFAWLEDAYIRRDTTLLSLFTSPVMKPLRADRRYSDLLRRLHFTS